MNKQTLNAFENNWENLKDKIQTQWNKLTDEDITQISGSYDRLIAKLKKSYSGLKADVIQDEVAEFLADNNLVEKSTEQKIKNLDLPTIKAVMGDYFEDYLQYIKNKSQVIETSTKKHVQDNPLKWLGVAALSGFVLAKIIRF